MKIAISAQEDNLDSMIDQRFGRCKYFIIADTGSMDYNAVENEGAIQGHGAGIKAAQQIGELDVKAVITGNLGPNATDVLSRLGIKAYHSSGKVEDSIQDFNKGSLKEITDISAPHSGDPVGNAKTIADQKKSKEERIFFPLLDDNGMDSTISDHFGHAPFFGLYDTKTKELSVIENNLDHSDEMKSPIDQIEEKVDPTTIFAKGIGARAITIITQKGLGLKTGDFSTVRQAVQNLDKLKDLTESCGH